MQAPRETLHGDSFDLKAGPGTRGRAIVITRHIERRGALLELSQVSRRRWLIPIECDEQGRMRQDTAQTSGQSTAMTLMPLTIIRDGFWIIECPRS